VRFWFTSDSVGPLGLMCCDCRRPMACAMGYILVAAPRLGKGGLNGQRIIGRVA
jgi:hypothetical protein